MLSIERLSPDPEDDCPFEPRKIVVKNVDPKTEYNLAEELGR